MEWITAIVNNLVTYFLFMCVATSFVPLPDFPVILHLAGLGAYPAWLIALIGGLGTCCAGLIDYIIVAQVRRLKRIDELLQHRRYLTMERYFKKIAFLSIVLSGFLVFIPFDLSSCWRRRRAMTNSNTSPRYSSGGRLVTISSPCSASRCSSPRHCWWGRSHCWLQFRFIIASGDVSGSVNLGVASQNRLRRRIRPNSHYLER